MILLLGALHFLIQFADRVEQGERRRDKRMLQSKAQVEYRVSQNRDAHRNPKGISGLQEEYVGGKLNQGFRMGCLATLPYV